MPVQYADAVSIAFIASNAIFPHKEPPMEPHLESAHETRTRNVLVDSGTEPKLIEPVDPTDDEQLTTHLLTMLSVATGMVGVCATAIGLIGILKSMNRLEMIVDDLFAIGSMLFIGVVALSFLGLRSRVFKTWPKLMVTLDIIFFLGLMAVVIATLLLTWVVI
jgi:hypothetical protein